MDRKEIKIRVNDILECVKHNSQCIGKFKGLFQVISKDEKGRNYDRVIPNKEKSYGVSIPTLRIIASEIGRFILRYPEFTSDLLFALWNEGSFESRQIVGKSLERFGPKFPDITLKIISAIVDGIDNWAVCDNLAMFGVEPVASKNHDLVLPLSESWIRSENKWIRRFGVVTLRCYKKLNVTWKVFEILGLVMDDDETDVRKAVAWILREISKANENEVAEFLIKWAKQGQSKNTRWIIKSALKKLTEKHQKQIMSLLARA